ncbi:MAG: 3-isopropylmalate dehydratase/homoaconitate hydratase family large subunit [Proteobacteria bacterium]|nr:3-isopropylmalate dehydratase/homoaconitate hydratase family large subunit [Pseudomonadota bacterium]
MGMTMAEKVLARTAGLDTVDVGEYVTVKPDRLMAHEAFALCALTLNGFGVKKLYDPDRIIVILDHYFPAPSIRMADAHVLIRQMVKEYGIKKFFGQSGVCHQVMCEKGEVVPGHLILGTDSHTTTYGAFGAAGAGIGQTEMSYVMATGELWMMVPSTIRFEMTGRPAPGTSAKDIILYLAGQYGTEVAQYQSIEFTGSAAEQMSLAGRMTMSNMGVELGAKFAFFAADEKTVDFFGERTGETVETFGPDPDAVYESVFEIDIGEIAPQVALPHNPGNSRPISEIGEIPVDQALLGSCSNGRLEDLAIAAEILKNRRVHSNVRFLITPASHEILKKATRAGFIQILIEAGAHITPAGCGACLGGHMGLLGGGESCISSTNRNFKGRMGSENAFVYLASPATVAASAVGGRITDPREFLKLSSAGGQP